MPRTAHVDRHHIVWTMKPGRRIRRCSSSWILQGYAGVQGSQLWSIGQLLVNLFYKATTIFAVIKYKNS